MISGKVRAEVSSQLNGHAMLFCRPDDVRIRQQKQLSDQRNIVPGIFQYTSFVGGAGTHSSNVANSRSTPSWLLRPLNSRSMPGSSSNHKLHCCQHSTG
jgi:hypothetical protein